MEQITLYFRKADAAEEGSMARFLNPPIAIPWRDLGRSALRVVVLTTAAGISGRQRSVDRRSPLAAIRRKPGPLSNKPKAPARIPIVGSRSRNSDEKRPPSTCGNWRNQRRDSRVRKSNRYSWKPCIDPSIRERSRMISRSGWRLRSSSPSRS